MSPRPSSSKNKNLNSWKEWFRDIKRLRWLFVMSLFLLMGVFWLYVTSYTIDSYSNQWEVDNVMVQMFAPQYVSANEEEEIRFAIANPTLEPAKITLELRSKALMNFRSPDDFYSGAIDSQAQVNRSIRIFFPFDRDRPTPTLNASTGLSLWGGKHGSTPHWVADLPLNIAPIPKARAVTNYLGALLAGLMLWMCKEMWDQVKA